MWAGENKRMSLWKSGELPPLWWRVSVERGRKCCGLEVSKQPSGRAGVEEMHLSGVDFLQQQQQSNTPPSSSSSSSSSSTYSSVTSLPHGPSPPFPLTHLWAEGRSICHMWHSYEGGKERKKERKTIKERLFNLVCSCSSNVRNTVEWLSQSATNVE